MADFESRVAIVAFDGVFPLAPDVDAMWRRCLAGDECLTDFDEAALRRVGVPDVLLRRADFIKRRPLIDDVEHFDASFFNFTDVEAEALDPQLRLLLQSGYRVLEQAGGAMPRERERTGVFAGLRSSRYLEQHLLASERHRNALGADYMQMINRKDSVATLLAYKLDLNGPAISVNTACSTSLLAVHLACNSLLAHECDLALAGGAAIPAFGPDGHLYIPGGLLSHDGSCRPFSADADGTIDGAGVALVGLRRLDDALARGSMIHAVILGSAVNNDGANRVGYTAPSVAGQSRVVVQALEVAGVEPASIGYVETHGTGTKLGDPIEIRALRQAYAQYPEAHPGPCFIGSLKANMGHLGAAAGVASLIKAAMIVRDGKVPPLANFTRPNPELGLDESPFRVPTQVEAWPAVYERRRAAVSSFGIGGTNVHLILEEPPSVEPRPAQPRVDELFVVGARTARALASNLEALARHVDSAPELEPSDVAHTLESRHALLPWRTFAVADTPAALARKLPFAKGRRVDAAPLLGFSFPGQGSQHMRMGLPLRARFAVFARELDGVAALVRACAGWDLQQLLSDADDATLMRTEYAQPALFAVEYALARFWQALGARPQALLGHSVGELVGACVAGVFQLEDVVRLVCERGRLMGAAPPGAMLSVEMSASELEPLLSDGLELIASNGRARCVAGGSREAIEHLAAQLARADRPARRLNTSHAFHSSSMQAASDRFGEVVSRVRLAAPSIAVISNVTGAVLDPEQATSPAYWAAQLRRPVQFARGFQTLAELGIGAVLEVGPGTVLTSLGRGELPSAEWIASQPHPSRANEAAAVFLGAAGELWSRGIALDLGGLRPEGAMPRLVALPGYQFEPVRHWVPAGAWVGAGEAASVQGVNPPPTGRSSAVDGASATSHPLESPTAASREAPSKRAAAAAADAESTAEAAVVGSSEPEELGVVSVVAAIWRRVLSAPDMGLADDFFALGGNSLWALQIVARVNESLGCRVHLTQLLEAPTIEAFALVVEQQLAAQSEVAALRPAEPMGAELSTDDAELVDDDELAELLDELDELPEEERTALFARMDLERKYG